MGTGPPSACRSAGRRSARSPRCSPDRTSRPDRTPCRGRRCARPSRRRSSFRRLRRHPRPAGRSARSPCRLSTKRTNGTSICCSSDRSTTPWTPTHRITDVFAETAQRRQVVAEDLDGDVGARSGQHVVDAMRDRLTDRHVGARQRRETAPQVREQLRTRPRRVAQADVDLRRFDALHVLVELGAARAARRRDDLRLREQNLLDPPANLVRLRQRCPRQRVRLDRQAAFVELGQESRAHLRHGEAPPRPAARQTSP